MLSLPFRSQEWMFAAAKNLALTCCGILAAMLLAEFVLFRLLLPAWPLKLHGYLHEGVRLLAQSSKRSAVPERSIALVGDSYAQGGGDWLLAADPSRNPPFHSAHALQARKGRDVVSFGVGMAASIRGLVVQPAAQKERSPPDSDMIRSCKCTPPCRPPDVLVSRICRRKSHAVKKSSENNSF